MKIKKQAIIILVLIILTFLTIVFLNYRFFIKKKVIINDEVIYVEIADDDSKRARGLMYREELDSDQGMLFIYDDEKIRNFWMKNTKIPLDMLFINEEKEIVDIIYSALPCKEEPCTTYSSSKPAKYVLEVNAGYAKLKNITISDIVKI